MTDTEREVLIEAWRVILTLEPSRALKVEAQERMRKLISERSAQRVRQMETEQGIAQ